MTIIVNFNDVGYVIIIFSISEELLINVDAKKSAPKIEDPYAAENKSDSDSDDVEYIDDNPQIFSQLAQQQATSDKAAQTATQAAAQAAAAQANSKPRGFFGSLGYAISGIADRVFKASDVLGNAFAGEFGLGKYNK